jgi:hypothetical protein
VLIGLYSVPLEVTNRKATQSVCSGFAAAPPKGEGKGSLDCLFPLVGGRPLSMEVAVRKITIELPDADYEFLIQQDFRPEMTIAVLVKNYVHEMRRIREHGSHVWQGEDLGKQ